MNNKKEYQEILVRLLTTDENSLENLARIAGQNPQNFYRTANFRNADLSSEDLKKFDLAAASIVEQIQIDRKVGRDGLQTEIPAPKQVRMSAEVSVYVHEHLSALFPGRLSYELEGMFWRIFDEDEEGFWDELNHGSAGQDAMNLIGDLYNSHSRIQHRFAYTFSSDLRDRVYKYSDLIKVSSGYVLSNLIYYVFTHIEGLHRGTVSKFFLEKVQARIAEKYEVSPLKRLR